MYIEQRVEFGCNIQPEINDCLQQAVACAEDFERARDHLYRARELARNMQQDQLEVYIALYKFCFYRGHLDEAEQVVLEALQESARRGGFAEDWNQLDETSADWTQQQGPARVYLYSMKALAFILLRKKRHAEAKRVLEKLAALDTLDLVGGSVIMVLSEAI